MVVTYLHCSKDFTIRVIPKPLQVLTYLFFRPIHFGAIVYYELFGYNKLFRVLKFVENHQKTWKIMGNYGKLWKFIANENVETARNVLLVQNITKI